MSRARIAERGAEARDPGVAYASSAASVASALTPASSRAVLEVGVRDERHAAGELDRAPALHVGGIAGFCCDVRQERSSSPRRS